MKRIHVLRVDGEPAAFVSLAAAMGEAGLRLGWLQLEAPSAPPALEEAVTMGALRAVAVGGGRSVAVKGLRGSPVARDLLREHFLGCDLVLVRGAWLAPRLVPVGSGWRIDAAAGAPVWSTAELVAALLRPHPWSVEPAAAPAEDR